MRLDDGKLLDRADWQLLRALQDQARLTFRQLSQLVGRTPPATAERVRRLEEDRIITGYHASIDPAMVGLPVTAFIRISVPGPQCARFGLFLRDVPEVLEGHRVTGGDSYIVKVVVASVAHLERLIDRLSQYGQPTTSLVLSTPVARRTIADGLVATGDDGSAAGPSPTPPAR